MSRVYVRRLQHLDNIYNGILNDSQIDAGVKGEKLSLIILEMRKLLEKLSMDNCTCDHHSQDMQSVLDSVNNHTNGRLSDMIGRVMGKTIMDGRARFQGFCDMNTDIDKDKIPEYCRGIDFRYPIGLSQINEGDVLYQWCLWKIHGDVSQIEVGQWFSRTEVEPWQLGVTASMDVYDSKSGFQGVGTRVLCSFSFPFVKDGFMSTAAGIYSNWSNKCYFDGNYIGGKGQWCDGGASQLFVPLTNKEKEILSAIAHPIRQWEGD